MLNQPTIEKLHTMKLHGMADAFRAQLETTESHQLSFEERFAVLVDHQWLWKENRALGRRLRVAKLKQRAVIEDVDYQHPRELDRKLLRTLASSEWVRQKLNIVFTGPTGIGKSWLASASRFCPGNPASYFGNWPSPMPMAAWAGCCSGWRRSMCCCSTILPWRP